jgi:hypothetical protein
MGNDIGFAHQIFTTPCAKRPRTSDISACVAGSADLTKEATNIVHFSGVDDEERVLSL